MKSAQPLERAPFPNSRPLPIWILAALGTALSLVFASIPAGLLGCVVGYFVELAGVESAWTWGTKGSVWLGFAFSYLAAAHIMLMGPGFEPGRLLDARRLPWGIWVTDWGESVWLGFSLPLQGPRLDLDGTQTLGGFDVATPDRLSLSREIVGILSAAVLTPALWALTLFVLALAFGNSGGGILEVVGTLSLAVVVPCSIAAVGLAVVTYGRRRALWTDRIRLEGSILQTDRGSFQFRTDPEVELWVDAAGSGLRLSDGAETLSFRGPYAALAFVVDAVPRIPRTEGTRQDVPRDLKSLQGAVVS